jgi:hypothetical protein
MGLLKKALLFKAGSAVFNQISRRRAAGRAGTGGAASTGPGGTGPGRGGQTSGGRGGIGGLVRSFLGGGQR